VSAVAEGEFRLRMAYPKAGRLRFLSHLEVARALERSARRASLPYAVTRGYSPHMKAAFGPALPVGTAGSREHWDLWLHEYVPAEDIMERMGFATPQMLRPFEAAYVPSEEPSLSAACTLGVYEIVVKGRGATAQSVGDAIDAVVERGELHVERKGKTKVYDLTTSLPKEPEVRSSGQAIVVDMTTRMGPQGSLRPDALMTEALSAADVVVDTIAITRTDVLIEDDEGVRRPL
jgi:radical SAM-linked protein